MKYIKTSILFFLIILLITTSACSDKQSPYYFDYPDNVTPKYCYENYKVFDANIRYTECYEFVTAKKSNENMRRVNFSAIKDSEDLSFMVYYKTIYWFGTNRWVGVIRHDDCSIQPVIDYTPSKIELCVYDDILLLHPDNIDVEKSPDLYYRYAEHTFSEPLMTITSPEAIAEIMAIAQKPTTMTLEENYIEQERYPRENNLQLVLFENEPVYVKISFEECSGLVWIGKLLTDGHGTSYMERLIYVGEPLRLGTTFATPLGKGFHYPLGEHMDAVVYNLMNQSN